ncbi:MAG: sugar-binding domain-containing protein [Paracoccaceae bacterium]
MDRKTKSEIADALGLSRFKVARLIDRAIEGGIVQFVIEEPSDINLALSEALRVKYGLKAAFVVEGPDRSSAQVTQPLGAVAAQFLEERLEDGMTLGVSWGQTIAATARAVSDLPKVDVVQVAGSPAGADISENPVELVHSFTKASGGTGYPVYGPMWADDPALIERLRHEQGIARAFDKCAQLDALIVGIGAWASGDPGSRAAFPKTGNPG